MGVSRVRLDCAFKEGDSIAFNDIFYKSFPVLQIGDDIGDKAKYCLLEVHNISILASVLIKDSHKESLCHHNKLLFL